MSNLGSYSAVFAFVWPGTSEYKTPLWAYPGKLNGTQRLYNRPLKQIIRQGMVGPSTMVGVPAQLFFMLAVSRPGGVYVAHAQ